MATKKAKSSVSGFVPRNASSFTGREYKGTLKCIRQHPSAMMPVRRDETDAAWECYLVDRCDGKTEDCVDEVTVFTTGYSFIPKNGHHIEIVAHPDLYKLGYMLVGSPIIVNPTSRDTVTVPLLKFREGEDLELPGRLVLIVARPTCYMYLAQVEQDDYQIPTATTTLYKGSGSLDSYNEYGKGKHKEPDYISHAPIKSRSSQGTRSGFYS